MSVRQRLFIAAFGVTFIAMCILMIACTLTAHKLYRYIIVEG